MEEVWKDVPGYEGLYQASNLGNVRSLDRTVAGKLNSVRKIYGKILSGTDDGRGYLKVAFQTNGRETRKLLKVHKIIALTFLEKTSIENPEVNHIDGNKINNNISNLEWSTPKNNVQHAIKNKLQDRSMGSKKTKVALIENDIIIKKFNSIAEANMIIKKKKKGSGISDVINNRVKTYKNTQWIKID